ncbi:MAG: hypothetical protein WB778_06265 [Thermoplasmata archaeon]
MTRSKRVISRKFWPSIAAMAVVIMAVVAWSTASNLEQQTPLGSTNSAANSRLSADSGTNNVLPFIAQVVNFTIAENTSGDTGPFGVNPSDTLVVFVELFGRTTVNNVTIENGPNDTFIQEAYLLDYVDGGTHGFSVWACTNVDGGPGTDVNVTLTGGSTDSAAIEVVDISGGSPYGGNPIPFVDQVADITHGNSRTPNEGLTVHADDLALLGIGTWSWNNVTTSAPRQVDDQVTTNSTVSGTNVTAAVLSYSNNNTSAKAVTMNGTLTTSAPWIVEIITLGATYYSTIYTVTFSETGLSTGTSWCQGVSGYGVSATQCETAPSGSTFDLANGTYYWNVSYSGGTNYKALPGFSGFITISGASNSVSITFTDFSPHDIQPVVIIVLENEAVSTIEKGKGLYENYLASLFPTASTSTSCSRTAAYTCGFFAQCHPSAPEYQSLITANTNQCGTDAYPTSGAGFNDSYTNATIANLLSQAKNNPSSSSGNFTWANYAENLPSNACTNPAGYYTGGTTGTAGSYAANGVGLFASKHVPFLYQSQVIYNDSSASYCKQHILSVETGGNGSGLSFNQSVLYNKMVNFSIITPNLCDDGHSACNGIWQKATCNGTAGGTPKHDCNSTSGMLYKQSDAWLRGFLGPLLNATGPYAPNSTTVLKEMDHTVFFILYDEAIPSSGSNVNKHGFRAANEPTGTTINDYTYCHKSANGGYDNSGACGGAIYLTVASDGDFLANTASVKKYMWTPESSDFGLLATVELIFNLTGVANDVTTAGNYGLCKLDTSSNHLTNPGCLDTLWIGEKASSNDYNPLTGAFTLLLEKDGNRY